MTESETDPLVNAVDHIRARMPHILSEHSDFASSLREFVTILGQSDKDVLRRAIEDRDSMMVASALGMSSEELQEKAIRLYERTLRVSQDIPELHDAVRVLRGLIDQAPRQ